MKILSLFIISILSLGIPGFSAGQVIRQEVYVDALAGNDNNTGLSPGEAWKSLEKVNAAEFGPGASILLKAGCTWLGQLYPKGSGNSRQPIVIDRYGNGSKPVINGRGMTGEGVVKLFNQSWWEINNLEIVNDAEEAGDRRGVEIKAANYGIVEHIHLKNLVIHHIKGIPGNGLSSKLTAGIYIATVADARVPTRFNDILIENCEIHHADNQGIVTNNEVAHNDYPGTEQWHKRKFTNVRIRDNVIHHIAKNAMIIRLTEDGIVEYNLCYETALKTTGNTIFSRSARGTVFQYNEGYLNRSPDYDGSLYDPDLNSPETIWQYSYSHDNAHGLVWFCTTEKDNDVIVRYNISRNDRGSLVYFNYDFASAYVYDNVFFIGEHTAPVIIRENPKNDHTYYFYNNVIYNNSRDAKYRFAGAGDSAATGKGVQNKNFGQNTFHGYHPEGEPEDTGRLPAAGGPGRRTGKPDSGTGKAVPVASDDPLIVASINGEPLFVREFRRELNSVKAGILSDFCREHHLEELPPGFWTRSFNGRKPLKAAREAALKKLLRIKVQQLLMKQKGVMENISYRAFLDSLAATNKLRREAVVQNKVIYGPRQYSEKAYFYYVFSNNVLRLKEKLLEEKLADRTHIETTYTKLVEKRLKEASVSLNETIYDQLSFN